MTFCEFSAVQTVQLNVLSILLFLNRTRMSSISDFILSISFARLVMFLRMCLTISIVILKRSFKK